MAKKPAARPVGRPTLYRAEYCDAVVEHMAEGASITSFAASIDVARDTITDWTQAHPEFLAAVKRAKAKCASWWEQRGREGAKNGAAPGANTLVIFGLKNMAPDDWRDTSQVDHRSSDGSMTPREPRYQLVPVKPNAGDK